MDMSYVNVMNLLEHGLSAVIIDTDGEAINVTSPKEFQSNFGAEGAGKKYRLAEQNGDYIVFHVIGKSMRTQYSINNPMPIEKYSDFDDSGFEENNDPEKLFIVAVGDMVSNRYGLNEAGREAVKGFIIGRLDSLKSRIRKYYGLNWYKFADKKSVLRTLIINYLKNYLIGATQHILTEYSDREGVITAEKGNYFNGVEGMTDTLNTNYDLIISDDDAMRDDANKDKVDYDPYRREIDRINDLKRKSKYKAKPTPDTIEPE